MTVFVYARRSATADRWARAQGLRPRDFKAFGDASYTNGWTYQRGDRVVILGTLSHVQQAVVDRTLVTSNAGIEAERYNIDAVRV